MIKSLIDLLFNNFWYKIGSLVLAFLVWAIIQGEEVLERNVKLNVHLHVAEGLKVAGKNILHRDVTIRGPRVLMGEHPDPLEAHVHLPARVGSTRILLGKEQIKDWNDRLKIVIHDAYVNVYIDEVSTKTVPIREIIQGAPADGYFVEKFTLTPNTVSITGLKSELKKIREVLTEPVNISGVHQSKTFEIALVKPDGFEPEDFSADATKITFQIGEAKTNNNFGSIRIEVIGGLYETEIHPRHAAIEIQGTPGVLSFVRRDDLRASVDVTGLAPGTYQRKIQVKIPPDTVLIDTFPEVVTVRVFERKRGS